MTPTPAEPRITLERTLQASLEEVWDLWTTAEGIEAWWGPDGFAVTVQSMDVRPGGELRYTMSASAPETVAFMRSHGLPVSTSNRARFTEVERPRRLAWMHLVDFVPGVAPYQVAHRLELRPAEGGGVRLLVTIDRMHDDTWTERAVMGWENELGRMARALAARTGARAR